MTRFQLAVAVCATLTLAASCDRSGEVTVSDSPPLDERFYRAHTDDGSVRFIFSKGMARRVFDTFCATAAAPTCDVFDAYSIEVSLGELALTYNFAHRQLRSIPMEDIPFVVTFGCLSLPTGLQCSSGEHSYD